MGEHHQASWFEEFLECQATGIGEFLALQRDGIASFKQRYPNFAPALGWWESKVIEHDDTAMSMVRCLMRRIEYINSESFQGERWMVVQWRLTESWSQFPLRFDQFYALVGSVFNPKEEVASHIRTDEDLAWWNLLPAEIRWLERYKDCDFYRALVWINSRGKNAAKVCKSCGKPFLADKGTRKNCTPGCSRKSWNAGRRKNYKTKKTRTPRHNYPATSEVNIP